MTIGSFKGQIFSRFPMNNITPFTYRDGLTYLEKLTALHDDLKDLQTDGIAQGTAIGNFIDEIEAFVVDLLGKLVGYTIEVGEDTYRAEMMDGSIFEAYTINGVDKLLTALETALRDLLDEGLDNFETRFDAFVTSVETSLNNMQVTITSQGKKLATTTNSLSGLLPVTVAHKWLNNAVGQIPYTVITLHNNANNDAGKHLRHELVDPNSVTSGAESLQTMSGRRNRPLVTNCCAMSSSQGLRGLVINKSRLMSDWEAGSGPYGVEVMARMADGTFKLYRKIDGHTGASMIADGVVDAWGFGPSVLRNGVVTDIGSNPGFYAQFATVKSARPIHGYTENGDFKIISVHGKTSANTGITGNDMGMLARAEGCTNAIVLDGGGSTQIYVNGKYEQISSDQTGVRLRRDFLMMNNVSITQVGGGWQTMQLGPTAKFLPDSVTGDDGLPRVKLVDDIMYFKGRIYPKTGETFPWDSEIVLAYVPDNIPRPVWPRERVVVGNRTETMSRCRIGSDGTLTLTTAREGDGNVAPSFVDLSGLSGTSI